MRTLKVLVTRPEPGASATAAQLMRLGFEPVLAPCLTIKPLAAKLPDKPAAIVVTSAQAIAGLPEHLHGVPCFCVGDATAARMREAGFTSVESASGDATDLFRLVMARQVAGMHLLAVGERHGLALARQLREAGVSVMRRTVYSARPLRVLPGNVGAGIAAGEIAAALFYSAETVRAFIRLRPVGTGGMVALALSPAIADVLQGLPWRAIRVAVAPSEADLLALLR